MKNLIRQFISRISIQLLRFRVFDRLVSFLAYQQKRVVRRRIEAHLEELGLYGNTVLTGPFAGMQYPPREQWASCRFEKIIGAYEFEIHELLENLIKNNQQYTRIIVIGAAEGFYAVGLARAFPKAHLFAFEPTQQKTDVLKAMAELNHVTDRITVEGFCDLEKLAAMEVAGNTLVICDVDGYEQELLNPTTVPWFDSADFIVELHDCFIPGISEEIHRRFSSSHKITDFKQTGVPYEQYPILKNLLFTEIDAMVGSDRKSLQNWFFMESSASQSN